LKRYCINSISQNYTTTKVEYTAPEQLSKSLILQHLKSRDIYKFAYLGHGAYGLMTKIRRISTDPEDEIIVGGKYTSHAIAEFHVIACNSADERKKWRKNVSSLGWLRTTTKTVSPIGIIF
jgi:hypothetical protein